MRRPDRLETQRAAAQVDALNHPICEGNGPNVCSFGGGVILHRSEDVALGVFKEHEGSDADDDGAGEGDLTACLGHRLRGLVDRFDGDSALKADRGPATDQFTPGLHGPAQATRVDLVEVRRPPGIKLPIENAFIKLAPAIYVVGVNGEMDDVRHGDSSFKSLMEVRYPRRRRRAIYIMPMIIERTPDFPDGPIQVRTHPLTYLEHYVDPATKHGWHQLTYAVRGHLEVRTDDVRVLIPHNCALWVPAGVLHSEEMRAPVSVRTIYLAPGLLPSSQGGCRTLAVSTLLRELILFVTQLGALDARNEKQARLIGVMVDWILEMPEVPLQLPTPRDPRARSLAAAIELAPDDSAPIAQLAKEVGASLRTIERCFLEDTGVSVGEWRRRFRMFEAMGLLEGGASVTSTAFDVGYRSVSAFTVAFTRQFGVMPSRR